MKRKLSFILAILMLFSLLPVSALAEEIEEPAEPAAEELVIDEEPVIEDEPIIEEEDALASPERGGVIGEIADDGGVTPEEEAEELPPSADADSSLEEGALEADIPAKAEPEASLSEGGVAGEAGDGGSEPVEEEPAEEEEPVTEETEDFAAEEAYAASGTCGDNLTWTLDDSGRLTISGTGSMNDYLSSDAPWYSSRNSIKQAVIQNGVTSIGISAFDNCSNLTTVAIGNSVTFIGISAFDNCTSLTSVIIPDSVTSIGDGAFYNCTKLTSVSIGNSVTDIRNGAFHGCTSLTSVTIPDSVISIWSSAFRGCTSLTSVSIGNGVTSIGEWAFDSCTSLIHVTIGNSVASIEPFAFSDCTSLMSVTIPDSVTSIRDMAFKNCTSLTSVGIPDSVTSIGGNAFCDCESLTSVSIGNGVSSIGGGAFSNCTNLMSVNIGNGVSSIERSVFYGCTSLTNVSIPDGVTSIGDYAFQRCESLTSVTIPDSVTSIGFFAFHSTSLTDVYYNGTQEQWNAIFINDFNTPLESASIHFSTVTPTQITAQPANATLGIGKTASFTVTASGTNLKYQWQYIAPGGAWANWPTDANTDTLSVPVTVARSGYKFRCKVSGDGGTVYSSAAKLIIATKINTQPAAVKTDYGKTASFTVKAIGTNLLYQWQAIAPGGAWQSILDDSIPSAKTATLKIPANNNWSGYKFRCRVVGDGGAVFTSVAKLTITTNITGQPAAVTTAYGNTASFTVKAVGTNLQYQWQAIAPGGAWKSITDSSIPSAKTAALKIPANDNWSGYKFRCRVAGDGGAVFTNVVKLTITTKINTQPANATANSGKTAAFTVKAVGTNLQYQWQYIAPGGSGWVSCTEATAKSASLKVSATAAKNGYKYRCRVVGDGGSVYTNVVKLTVK